MSGLVASIMQQAVQRHQQGALADAIRLYRQVLALVPRQTDAMNLLGVALVQSGQAAAGERSIRDALALRPRTWVYLANLGAALVEQRRFADAAASFRATVRLQPDAAAVWSNLGNALREMKELAQAEDACRTALRFDPRGGEAHANLGNVLRLLGRAEEALDCYRTALPLMPGDPTLLVNYGGALRDLGRVEEAEHQTREALRCAPNHPQVRYGLAHLCLAAGHSAEGWALFEARHDLPEAPWRTFPVPLWAGERTALPVLLHAEEGIGDTIQFARFVAEAARHTGVVLEAPPLLHRLFRTLDGPEAVVSYEDPAPRIAAHLPLMSLPRRLGIVRSRLGNAVPYLRADPTLQEQWQSRLSGLAGRRIGLAWAGSPGYFRDRGGSIPFALLAPLLAIPDTSFVSLQKGSAAAQVPVGAPIYDWSDALGDFADTAALITALDLVISVDTAVAHLTGALGHPVWLLNRFDSDWRWELGTTESIWYPTLRQFRQPAPGDWEAVIAAVGKALRSP